MYNYIFFLIPTFFFFFFLLIPTTYDFVSSFARGCCYVMDLCLCYGFVYVWLYVLDLFTIKFLRI